MRSLGTIIVTFIMFVTFDSLSNESEQSKNILYVSVPDENGLSSTFNFNDGKMVYLGDVGLPVTSCSDEQTYCLDMVSFTLSIPKKSTERGQKWFANGFEFSYIADSLIGFRGLREEVKIIKTDQNLNFMYSEDKGVLGFTRTYKNSSYPTTYLLWNNTGINLKLH